MLSSIDSIVNLVWKNNDLTLKSKLNLVYFDLFLKINTKQVLTLSVYLYAPRIYQLCCSISHSQYFMLFFSLLPNSGITYRLLNKIFWQNKMLFWLTIPSFFQPETWNTHIFFWPHKVEFLLGKEICSCYLMSGSQSRHCVKLATADWFSNSRSWMWGVVIVSNWLQPTGSQTAGHGCEVLSLYQIGYSRLVLKQQVMDVRCLSLCQIGYSRLVLKQQVMDVRCLSLCQISYSRLVLKQQVMDVRCLSLCQIGYSRLVLKQQVMDVRCLSLCQISYSRLVLKQQVMDVRCLSLCHIGYSWLVLKQQVMDVGYLTIKACTKRCRYMSHVTTKPVFGVCDQLRLKLVC